MSNGCLTDADKKFWPPIDTLVSWLANQIPAGAKVLEIGPGFEPFPRATSFVDYKPLPLPNVVNVDMNKDRLPFSDKEFDYVYCRHVLEDMYNPFLLLEEMGRVGKAGYIETPSPIAELCRGVDGASPPFRGYHHHSFIIWPYEKILRFIVKYPIVEYIRFSEEDLTRWLRQGPKLWNSYFSWTGKIDYKFIQSGPDYVITRDYSTILKNAMDQSEIASNAFWQDIPDKATISISPLTKETAHV